MRILTLSTLIALSVAGGTALAADLRAVTEDGRKVILSADGKWHFAPAGAGVHSAAVTGSPYQTAVPKFSLAFNTDEWFMLPKDDSEDTNKRVFKHKTLPLYGMVIADEMAASTPSVKEVILSNARRVAADAMVLLDDSAQVSGKDVGKIRVAANIKGVDFLFSSYYYADQDGNIQVTCYTSQALFAKYQAACEKFQASLRIQ